MSLEKYVGLDHFRPDEFTEPERMDEHFLKLLDKTRELAGVPFRISSSHRTDDTPDTVDSTHEIGLAVDIEVDETGSCQTRSKIVRAAHTVGITRIGFYDRHIHLDIGDRVDRVKWAPNCMWWGVSK